MKRTSTFTYTHILLEEFQHYNFTKRIAGREFNTKRQKVCLLLAVVAPALVTARLETKENVTSNSHRIMQQFSF